MMIRYQRRCKISINPKVSAEFLGFFGIKQNKEKKENDGLGQVQLHYETPF